MNWKTVKTAHATAAGAIERLAFIQGARACGCDGCRIAYDPRAQARAIEEMFGVPQGKRRAPDRRPS